ncbi:MAG: efflux RND transporter periplasmic adaptor subunit [Kiritimatiellae bacterium]|nr:efflux RND transporter periplasmic adaptor subunit [Kiritimatiellia bacterium]
MKWIKWAVVLAVFAGAGWGGWRWWASRKVAADVVQYRLAPIARANVVRTVEATGTVTPRNSSKGIPVGAQVNGKIIKLFVDYNSTVTNGQVVALIDPQVYEAEYRRALGQLHAAEASVLKCEAELALAEKTLARKASLLEKEMAPMADYDAALQARDSARASLAQAKAQVEQSQATTRQSKANLDYCTIVSPVNGKVIARKVEEGETVVSSMNAVPVLTIAEDLKTIWVEASVPEADVGQIKVGQTVSFTADAYRRKFTGKVKQIRLASETTNNVVTYPIIIEAENPDEMLFPGMTANISVETARADDVVVVAAAAFRFRPKPADYEKAKAAAGGELPRGRKLWFEKPDGGLEPVLVEEGISDESFTQIVGGEKFEGRSAVVGYETAGKNAAGKDGDTKNPFMPKFPQRNKNKGTAPEPKK